jgi:hypothetical protein
MALATTARIQLIVTDRTPFNVATVAVEFAFAASAIGAKSSDPGGFRPTRTTIDATELFRRVRLHVECATACHLHSIDLAHILLL